MNNKNFLLTTLSIVLIVGMVYFFGASITGQITQTMYCEEGVCKKFCNYDFDCMSDSICCNVNGFGVCEDSSKCEEPFEFVPVELGAEVLSEDLGEVQTPQKISSQERGLYYIFGALALLLAVHLIWKYGKL